MKVCYIIGKYTEKTSIKKHQNIKKAVKEGIKQLLQGYCIIVPHANFIGHQENVGYNTVMTECFELIKRSDKVFVCKNYKTSKGSKAEIEWAKSLGKEIEYEV